MDGATTAFITSTGIPFRERLVDVEGALIETEAGCVPITLGALSPNVPVVSLLRSGHEGSVPPHDVNYRANMLALHRLGVRRILATSVVGALRPTLPVGQVVVVDQFLDFTRHRPCTVFVGDHFRFVDFTQPYCPTLRQALLQAAWRCSVPAVPQACYVGVDGPRYETAAEVRMFALLGGDVIGQSNIPEAIFARELGMCYATIAVVSNPAAGLTSQPVLIEEINSVARDRGTTVVDILCDAASRVAGTSCQCAPATRTITRTA